MLMFTLFGQSDALGGLHTQFNVYFPPETVSGTKVPALIYLAGLTCNEDTASAFKLHGVSPR